MERISKTDDIGSHIYGANLLGEVLSKTFKKNKNGRCFNCGKQGHLKRYCRHGNCRNNFFCRNNLKIIPWPSEKCRRYDKALHWTNDWRSTRDRQGNPLPLGKI